MTVEIVFKILGFYYITRISKKEFDLSSYIETPKAIGCDSNFDVLWFASLLSSCF